ncbi:hypothetical protein Dsin_014236 [Dipteronia sinensis]|uniref:RRM domain-containing protein n=1 Tax=Dipteronia sinensis TaxID=43782 RepID=A0AAE0E9R2_9ROSI|nr:hypothetical protein Dsin_014236 [Dipteronia sinensis]
MRDLVWVEKMKVKTLMDFVNSSDVVVDQRFLWNLFKVFGRVRDIHLSEATKYKKIGYAFVSFGTIEEARKVAEKTNGMHVYGWPIQVKVSQRGWKAINRASASGNNRYTKQIDDDKKASMEGRFNERKEWSYADVLKVKLEERVVREKVSTDTQELVITESWLSDGLWLENSAVGVMRVFSNVSRVKRRLLKRGFSSSTKFLGGKAIL